MGLRGGEDEWVRRIGLLWGVGMVVLGVLQMGMWRFIFFEFGIARELWGWVCGLCMDRNYKYACVRVRVLSTISSSEASGFPLLESCIA